MPGNLPCSDKEIFLAALEHEPGEARARFLDEACAGNTSRRAQIEKWLEARVEDDDFRLGGSIDLFFEGVRLTYDDLEATPQALDNTAAPSSSLKGVPGHRVEEMIARGGMGAVYTAKQLALERVVAVKVMTSQAKSPELAARFRQEALVLGRLEHPNIIPIHELGRDSDSHLYYTMKLVKGRTLQRIINDLREKDNESLRQHTLVSLLTVFRKICDALAFAHSERILHRDLKPENIMVGEFGEVLVMDWGLAKMMDDEAEPFATDSTVPTHSDSASDSIASFLGTLAGAVLGTPQYMSPEQARGAVDELDERSDVFSLGAILYAILTLRPPVEGKTLNEILEKVKSGHITPPTAYGTTTSHQSSSPSNQRTLEARMITPLPHIDGGRAPAALSAVAMKALSREKEQRYQSVSELSSDLESYQAGFATKAEQASLFTQLALLIRRNKGAFTTAAAALLLITTLGLWFIWNLRAKEQRATDGERKAVTEKEAARMAAAQASISVADAALREADGPAMQAALDQVPPDLRSDTWRYLLREADNSVARVNANTAIVEDAAPDPTRPSVFAMVDRDQMVSVVNVRTGERLLGFRWGFSKLSPTTAPDSNRYLHTGQRFRIAFSPDGQHIALGRDGPGGLVIHSAKDGQKEHEWPSLKTEYLQYSGESLLLRQGDGKVEMWNPDAGEITWKLSIDASFGQRSAFLPGMREILVATSKQGLRLFKTEDGSLVRELGGRSPTYDWNMGVRPDGKAAITFETNLITECVSLKDGTTLFQLPGKRPRRGLGYSPDGSMLFTAAELEEGGQSIEVWNAQTGELVRSLLGGRGEVTRLVMHPLSNELLIAGAETRAWDPIGPLPQWEYKVSSTRNMSFWGQEDLVFGRPLPDKEWGLFSLDPANPDPLWLNPEWEDCVTDTSTDQSLAVASKPGSHDKVLLLRKDGTKITEGKPISVGQWPYRLRPSPKATKIVAMGRVYEPQNLAVFHTSGKECPKLECAEGMFRLGDVRWLGEDRLVGLVTLHAARGQVGSAEGLILWDADTGQQLRTLTQPTTMSGLAVAPDGTRFAEAGSDKLIRIRDAKTLEVTREFRAHNGPITVLAWHPTKPLIASGSTDLTIRVWNVDTGQQTAEFRDLVYPPDDLDFSPSGTRLSARTFPDLRGLIWSLDTSSSSLGVDPRTELTMPRPPKGLAGFSDWSLNAQWKNCLSDKQKVSVLVFPEKSTDSAVRVRYRVIQTERDCFLDLVLRQSAPEGEAPRYVTTFWPNQGSAITVGDNKSATSRRDISGRGSHRDHKTDEEHTAELYAIGNRLTAFLDGQQYATGTDDTFSEGFGAVMVGAGMEVLSVESADLSGPYGTGPKVSRTDSTALPPQINSTVVTQEAPFVNSLGMKFVPVPGTGTLFAIWPTRMADYTAYAESNPKASSSWKDLHFGGVAIADGPDHPVGNVTWDEARSFCAWLTEREHTSSTLPPELCYRLPTDAEWTTAVGQVETAATPEGNVLNWLAIYAEGRNRNWDFPWGPEWPPTRVTGNYADETFREAFPNLDPQNAKATWIPTYRDGFVTTSPVGSFPANALGLYDMSGNVSQWCEDWYDMSLKRNLIVQRSCSWRNGHTAFPPLSRRGFATASTRYSDTGFRCVVATGQPPTPRPTAPDPSPAPSSVSPVAPVALSPREKWTWGGHTYQFVASDGIPWPTARAEAEKLGGHLATITTAEEDEKLWGWANQLPNRQDPNLSSNGQIWIGAQRLADSQQWKWVTEEPFAFEMFHLDTKDAALPAWASLYKGPKSDPKMHWNEFLNDTGATQSIRHQIRGFFIEWDSDSDRAKAGPWPNQGLPGKK